MGLMTFIRVYSREKETAFTFDCDLSF